MPLKGEKRREYLRRWSKERRSRETPEEREERLSRHRAYREANPEYFKRKRVENRDRNKEKKAEWIANHYEHYRGLENARNRRRRAADLETARRKDAERYARGKYKPGSNRPYNARRRARLRAAGGEGLSRARWTELLELYEYRCAYCGRSDVSLTVEHVVPLSRGGDHDPGNIVPACATCNKSKGSKLLSEWRMAS